MEFDGISNACASCGWEFRKTNGVRAIQANAENLPFKDEFDVISATDVMEHVLNLSNFMLTTNWALRKGGVFAVRVPYKENMIYYSRFFGLPFPYTHLRSFNKQLLVETVEQYGFKVLRVHYDGFRSAILQDFWKRSAKLERKISAAINNAFPTEDHVAGIDPRLGRLFMKPIEITVIAVKTKDVETRNVYENFFDYRAGETPNG